MEIIKTNISGVVILEPKVFHDNRGFFMETFKEKEFREKVCDTIFIQENENKSSYGVLRGIQVHPHGLRDDRIQEVQYRTDSCTDALG